MHRRRVNTSCIIHCIVFVVVLMFTINLHAVLPIQDFRHGDDLATALQAERAGKAATSKHTGLQAWEVPGTHREGIAAKETEELHTCITDGLRRQFDYETSLYRCPFGVLQRGSKHFHCCTPRPISHASCCPATYITHHQHSRCVRPDPRWPPSALSLA